MTSCHPHKKPWVAFLLSLAIPGVGLWYLGYWKWGAINLLVVTFVLGLLIMIPLVPGVDEYIHYVMLALAAASAGVAHAFAELNSQGTKTPDYSPPGR